MQGAGAGKGVLGTHVPLLKEQQETEAERGHPVKLEVHPAQAANKRPKAGQPGSSVPPEDVHTVEEGGREVCCCCLLHMSVQKVSLVAEFLPVPIECACQFTRQLRCYIVSSNRTVICEYIACWMLGF